MSLTPLEMEKIKEICKKWNLTELNFTKGIFMDDNGITVNLRGDPPIIGVTIAGMLCTEGHGNLRVSDLEAEIMNVLKVPKTPVRIDETSQSSRNDKKAEVKDDSHKITQRKSDDQNNVSTRPQGKTKTSRSSGNMSITEKSKDYTVADTIIQTERRTQTKGIEKTLSVQSPMSSGNPSVGIADDITVTEYRTDDDTKVGTPDTKAPPAKTSEAKMSETQGNMIVESNSTGATTTIQKDKLQKAKCKECNLEFEITLAEAQKIFEQYDGIYCQGCLAKGREIKHEEKEKQTKKKKGDNKVMETKIKMCSVCGIELSATRALECFQKDKMFVCEDCEEKKKEETTMAEKLPTIDENENENKLTVTKIKQYLCPTATDAEAYNFLQLCVHRDLNPFLREAYLIKYGTMPATMVVGKDAFTKKAEESGKLDGFEAGIIIKTSDGKIERRVGVVQFEGDILIGGWAKIFRKDMKHPFVCEVPLSEYMKYKDGKPQSSWAIMPGTMIRKVALVSALREGFTKELGGCYDKAEMGVEEKHRYE